MSYHRRNENGQVSIGCFGCIGLIIVLFFFFALFFGLRVGDKTLEIDVFPPGIYFTEPSSSNTSK